MQPIFEFEVDQFSLAAQSLANDYLLAVLNLDYDYDQEDLESAGLTEFPEFNKEAHPHAYKALVIGLEALGGQELGIIKIIVPPIF